MHRQVMWSPWVTPGLEHLWVGRQGEGVCADGLIVGVKGQEPFRVRYKIHCDELWRVRDVHIQLLSGSGTVLHLLTDGEGAWTTESGESVPMLTGCLDVDISATPFTNTLPIRRLGLSEGEFRHLKMAYVSVPELQVKVTEQRYTCLESTVSGGQYLFESVANGVVRFRAELPVDRDGLVEDYPGLFKRVGDW